jgi:hypothetical protein
MKKDDLLYAIDKYLGQSHVRISLIDVEYSDSVPAFLLRESKKLIAEYDTKLSNAESEYKIMANEYNELKWMMEGLRK